MAQSAWVMIMHPEPATQHAPVGAEQGLPAQGAPTPWKVPPLAAQASEEVTMQEVPRQQAPALAGGVKVIESRGRLATVGHSRESNFLAEGAVCSSPTRHQPLFSTVPSTQAWASETMVGEDQVYGPTSLTEVIAARAGVVLAPGAGPEDGGVEAVNPGGVAGLGLVAGAVGTVGVGPGFSPGGQAAVQRDVDGPDDGAGHVQRERDAGDDRAGRDGREVKRDEGAAHVAGRALVGPSGNERGTGAVGEVAVNVVIERVVLAGVQRDRVGAEDREGKHEQADQHDP